VPSPLLATLQAVRLKGRTTAADVAAATGSDEAAAGAALASLVGDGLLVEKSDRFRLTPEGKEQLGVWLEEERGTVDVAALEPLYEQFDPHNSRLKELASAWQQRDGEMNDHTDAEYDGKVLEGLDALHADFGPLVDRFVELAPRLAPYPARFTGALEKVRAGDHAYFLRPIIDSYHTVWFELHEDLIGLLGRNRQDEALAGRAE
jgi:pyruvate,orthophosphate dikinase